MIRAFLTWLNPPEPEPPPIYEHYHGLGVGTTGVAEGWVNLIHLAKVCRAREEANRRGEKYRCKDGRRIPYPMEAPNHPIWLPWIEPAYRPRKTKVEA